MALFGLIEDDVWDKNVAGLKDQIDAYVKTGVPALQSAVEKQAIDWLQQQNEATQNRLDEEIGKQLNAPASEFGQALADSVKGSVFKEYGLYIVGGVVGIAVIGFILLRK